MKEEKNSIEDSFESANAMQCKKCGKLVACDHDAMEEHMEEHNC